METELICITQSETSAGTQVPLGDIYSLKRRDSDVLMALDIVSSVPYVDVDYTDVDCTFFSVQKGLDCLRDWELSSSMSGVSRRHRGSSETVILLVLIIAFRHCCPVRPKTRRQKLRMYWVSTY